ncbi:MAG: serine protease [Bacteroidaceae bacterium]|nr:serine protease [Bacteroidaceae bacterium]
MAAYFLTSGAAAQPKWLKKVRKAQVNLVSYDANGQLLHSTNGFFIDETGTLLSDYSSFRGASRAVAIDEKGNEYPILSVAGASSLYDVIKLQASISKNDALPLASVAAQQGAAVYVAPYLSNKSGVATATTIESLQLFNDTYPYYTLPLRLTEKSVACPVLNEAGEVLALLQMSSKADEQKSYAISAAYVRDLRVNALSATSSDYRDVLIRKSLPSEASQAASFIYLLGTRDTATYLSYVADYIRLFPSETNGYTMQAEMLASAGRYAEADASWQAGLEAKTSAPELQYSRARSILAAVQSTRQLPEGWTLDEALSQVQQASAADPQPVYLALQGHILYAMQRYDEAAARFVDVCSTPLRSADHFLYAAQCYQMKADTVAVLAMQDSAVACFTKPYPTEAAPSLLMRATTLRSLHRYRESVMDLNDYEHLMAGSLNANFYYQRYQTEMQCRMFQQALSDIDQCTRLAPQEPLYFAERAATCFRFSQVDEAVIAARRAVALDDTFADAHRILGICLRAQQKEAEAQKELQRAVELGDEIAKTLLNK